MHTRQPSACAFGHVGPFSVWVVAALQVMPVSDFVFCTLYVWCGRLWFCCMVPSRMPSLVACPPPRSTQHVGEVKTKAAFLARTLSRLPSLPLRPLLCCQGPSRRSWATCRSCRPSSWLATNCRVRCWWCLSWFVSKFADVIVPKRYQVSRSTLVWFPAIIRLLFAWSRRFFRVDSIDRTKCLETPYKPSSVLAASVIYEYT